MEAIQLSWEEYPIIFIHSAKQNQPQPSQLVSGNLRVEKVTLILTGGMNKNKYYWMLARLRKLKVEADFVWRNEYKSNHTKYWIISSPRHL